MNRALPLLLAALLGLAACGDDEAATNEETGATAPVEENDTWREAGEAMDALGNAARETGEAARSAAEDAADALGPALERAGDAAGELLDRAEEGLNDVTRSAACETAQAADDQEGIEANC